VFGLFSLTARPFSFDANVDPLGQHRAMGLAQVARRLLLSIQRDGTDLDASTALRSQLRHPRVSVRPDEKTWPGK
jgi:hypothetical protein